MKTTAKMKRLALLFVLAIATPTAWSSAYSLSPYATPTPKPCPSCKLTVEYFTLRNGKQTAYEVNAIFKSLQAWRNQPVKVIFYLVFTPQSRALKTPEADAYTVPFPPGVSLHGDFGGRLATGRGVLTYPTVWVHTTDDQTYLMLPDDLDGFLRALNRQH